ncbi:unnamed protein product [Calypogeia fissa]
MEIRRTWMLLLFLLLVGVGQLYGTGTAKAEQCPGRGWEGKIVAEDLRFVSQDRSGDRYRVGENGDTLPLLHLYGSPFELGRAHGVLLRVEIQSMYLQLFRHMENEWICALHLTLLPDIVARKIARWALNAALDATYLLTLKYLPTRFVDEMLGLAQGAEVDYQDVVRIQMVPELFQASCSMLGSWGPATQLTPKGGLYQMRALDWDISSPLLDYHTVINYHPSDGNSFAIFTWAGFVGCISGYSGRLGVSEKAWVGYGGTGSHRGMPWHFVLRDILQFTNNLEGAWNLLMETQRTCPILVGIGSLEDDKFFLLGYAADVLQLHDDSNFTMVRPLSQLREYSLSEAI